MNGNVVDDECQMRWNFLKIKIISSNIFRSKQIKDASWHFSNHTLQRKFSRNQMPITNRIIARGDRRLIKQISFRPRNVGFEMFINRLGILSANLKFGANMSRAKKIKRRLRTPAAQKKTQNKSFSICIILFWVLIKVHSKSAGVLLIAAQN